MKVETYYCDLCLESYTPIPEKDSFFVSCSKRGPLIDVKMDCAFTYSGKGVSVYVPNKNAYRALKNGDKLDLCTQCTRSAFNSVYLPFRSEQYEELKEETKNWLDQFRVAEPTCGGESKGTQ